MFLKILHPQHIVKPCLPIRARYNLHKHTTSVSVFASDSPPSGFPSTVKPGFSWCQLCRHWWHRRYDNLRCHHQWRQIWHHDNSQVITTSKSLLTTKLAPWQLRVYDTDATSDDKVVIMTTGDISCFSARAAGPTWIIQRWTKFREECHWTKVTSKQFKPFPSVEDELRSLQKTRRGPKQSSCKAKERFN